MKNVLVTGCLGFIGYHYTLRLLNEGYNVIGIDNINGYYDVKQKYDKLPLLGIYENSIWSNLPYISNKYESFSFLKTDITNRYQIEKLFDDYEINIVVNLAAQAGVQYSIKNPHSYIENNITGFINLIDASKRKKIEHFIYASSSSVYGNRDSVPFMENDNVDAPISLYAASKKANELIAHSYAHLYGLKTTGLRFFTVYGPWGRPDMAPFIFTKNILENKPITVFNQGNLLRDFTFIDDIIEGMYLITSSNDKRNKYSIYNIGHSEPVNVNEFLRTIEKITNKKANVIYKEMREGDVYKTYASIDKIHNDFNYKPRVNIEKGLIKFINWYYNYFNINQ